MRGALAQSNNCWLWPWLCRRWTPRSAPACTTPHPCTTSSRRSTRSTTGGVGISAHRMDAECRRAWRIGGLQAWSEASQTPVPTPSHPSLCCRATLMYLAFVSQDTLPQDFRQVRNRLGMQLFAASVSKRHCFLVHQLAACSLGVCSSHKTPCALPPVPPPGAGCGHLSGRAAG